MPKNLRRVSRALLSVSDKAGLIDFAKALNAQGIELLSTGGTAKAIAAAGLPVRDVSDVTGFPEMMDGRVKTLHPKIHGGLLGIRGNPEHEAAMLAHGIAPIDLLVVNLYPFEETLTRSQDYDTLIENIDIGGPAMIRGAAKNHGDVAVVVDVEDYALIIQELKANSGATTLATRKALAAKAMRGQRLMMPPFQIGSLLNSEMKRRIGGRLAEKRSKLCAMVRIRIKAQPSIKQLKAVLVLQPRANYKASSSLTIISMIQMPLSNALPNLIPQQLPLRLL